MFVGTRELAREILCDLVFMTNYIPVSFNYYSIRVTYSNAHPYYNFPELYLRNCLLFYYYTQVTYTAMLITTTTALNCMYAIAFNSISIQVTYTEMLITTTALNCIYAIALKCSSLSRLV